MDKTKKKDEPKKESKVKIKEVKRPVKKFTGVVLDWTKKPSKVEKR